MSDNGDDSNFEAWLARVRVYIEAGDRGREPCYVGREDLFELVDRMVKSASHTPGDRTISIGGAPGAGKTAFLRELRERALADTPGDVLPVEIEPEQCTPLGVYEVVLKALGLLPRPESEQSRSVRGGVAIPGVRGEVNSGHRERIASDRDVILSQGHMSWELMRERFTESLAGRVVLLLCDEAQTLDPRNKLVQAAVRSLHRGDRDVLDTLRIVPVFAGLCDTETQLRRCGVTRQTTGNVHSIDALTPRESENYALRVLKHLDARGSQGEIAAWARWIVDNGDGWPHHLRGLTEATARAMSRAETPQLRRLDRQWIAEWASERRCEYYDDRVGATDHPRFKSVFTALSVEASRSGGAGLDELVVLADKLLEGTIEPPGPVEAVDGAIHAGILQHIRSDRLACPIPSMLRWLESGHYRTPNPPATPAAPPVQPERSP